MYLLAGPVRHALLVRRSIYLSLCSSFDAAEGKR